jgi:ABC-type lipoprotein release transport system permease subunit
MIRYIQLAWRNIWRNWRRTMIATIAIVLGLVLLIFMDAMIKGSDQAMFANAVRLYGGNIQIHAPGYGIRADRQPILPLENADEVVQLAMARPEVALASKRINTGGMVSDREGTYPVTITGIQPTVEAPLSLVAENITQGRFLQDDDVDAIILGKGLADLLDVSVGDRVTLIGRRQNETMRQHGMTIVGVFDLGLAAAEKGMVFINLSDAQTLYNLRGQETEVTISLQDLGKERATMAALQNDLPNYEVDSWETLMPELRQTMDIKAAFSTIFGLIVLMIASIGILNLMLMAVFERTREMGVLAALGMKGRQVMGLFVLEGVFIGLVGALIGCLLGWALITAVGQVGIDLSFAADAGDATALMGDRLFPSATTLDIIGNGLAVLVIAALASIYPAWLASRQEPAQALHHV